MRYLLIITILTLTQVDLFGQKKYYLIESGDVLDATAYNKLVRNYTDSLQNFYKRKNIQFSLNQSFDLIRKNADSVIFSTFWSTKTVRHEIPIKHIEESEDFVGKEFPLSKVQTLDKDSICILDLKGKPTLINFWFSYCQPCIEEMNSLNEIKVLFGDKVNFIAITFNDEKQVRNFLLRTKFDFKHIINAQAISNRLKINGYPTNVFLNKEGKIVRVTGSIPKVLTSQNAFDDKASFIDFLNQLLQPT